jgi:hypothetical protein
LGLLKGKFSLSIFFQFYNWVQQARNLPGGKGRPARETDNLTAIYEPIA